MSYLTRPEEEVAIRFHNAYCEVEHEPRGGRTQFEVAVECGTLIIEALYHTSPDLRGR